MVARELIEHALNVDPKARLVKQPLRRFDEPKRKVIEAELHMLENAGSSGKSRHRPGCLTQ
jgi:hypothetical protein